MQVYSIHTGNFKLDGGAMFGVVPKSIWNKTNPADENNLCTWALRCMLIVSGDRTILIDTGMGDKQDAKFFSHYHPSETRTITEALAEHGFKPESITDVLLTHVHFDHVGGAVWCVAVDVVVGLRRGTASTPRSRHGRRPPRQPSPHALYDPRGLSVF